MADGGGDAGAGGPPPLASVRDFWAALDLEALKRRLDGQGLQIAALQEDSLENRRRLAEATREFKRTAPEDVVRGVAALLKSYQEEARRRATRLPVFLTSTRAHAPSKTASCRAPGLLPGARCSRGTPHAAAPPLRTVRSHAQRRPTESPACTPPAGGPADQARQALGGLLPGALSEAV